MKVHLDLSRSHILLLRGLSWLKTIGLFFLLCIGLSSSAQNLKKTFKGIVVDENQQPLSSISVHLPQLKESVRTDQNGYFVRDNLSSGTYLIEISGVGFQTLKTTFSISDSDKPHYFTLKKNRIALESVNIQGLTKTQEINRQAYNVTAIDATKLHNISSDIGDVLHRVAGAHLRESGGIGSDIDFSINGFSGKRVKFFIDGVPMEGFGPSFQINNIPINLAERIEVYKGVIPVWLGSDALGGAVNLITSHRKNFLEASYSLGSFNSHQSYLNFGVTSKKGLTFQINAFQNYSDNNYKVNVDAADLYSGKYYPNARVKRFHDQYHNETLISKVGFVDQSWADQLLIGFTLGQYYQQIQTGAQMSAVYGQWHKKGAIVTPSLQYVKKNAFTKGLDISVNGNYNMGKESSIDTANVRYNWFGEFVQYRGKGGEQWYSLYRYRNHIANFSATATYQINDRQFIALNNVYSYFNRKGKNQASPGDVEDTFPRKAQKNILGLSYQYRLSDQWDATLMTKLTKQNAITNRIETDYQIVGNNVKIIPVDIDKKILGYGFAASYKFTPNIQWKFSYEKTSRMPEPEDLFGDVANRLGNPLLKPEISNNLNVGLQVQIPLHNHHFYLNANGVYYAAKDYIYNFITPYTNQLQAQNLFQVDNLGLEMEFRYRYLNKLSIGFNTTYQNIRDNTKYRIDMPGEKIPSNTYRLRIPNVPYLFGNTDFTYSFSNFLTKQDVLTIMYTMFYVHEFYLFWSDEGAKDTRFKTPQQIAHDAGVTYSFSNGRYNIALESKNIYNARLFDNYSLQKPGRSFFLKFRCFIKMR